VRAEAGHVILRLELASLRDRLDVHLVEIVLEGQYAANLGFGMIEATKSLHSRHDRLILFVLCREA
jgi:hypothetical protein